MGITHSPEHLKKWNEDTQRWPLWSRAGRTNPHALYARMREEEPIARLTGPVFGGELILFTRYDDSAAMLKDARFIKDFRTLQTPEELAERNKNPNSALDYHMLNFDPPDHTRLRTLVSKAFTPKMIAGLEPRIQAITDALIADMQQKGEVNLIDDFAFPLPITVIAEMLGIPVEDRVQFRRWTQMVLFGLNQEENTAAGMQVLQYFMRLFEQRRADPQEDLISALLHIEEQGDRLNSQELLSMIFLLLVAGFETTVNLIGNGVYALLQHPDQLALLREKPELIGTAVEEILRFESPVENTIARFAAEDTEWDGVPIRRGQNVYASLLSANRDPRQFPNPDVFDITRTPNKHIAFGHGIHYCLGAPLARIEGAAGINSLLHAAPNLALAVPPDELHWNEMITFHALRALPVTL